MASCILLCLMSSQKSIDLDLHCRLQHTRSKSRYISVCSIVFKNSSILHTYYIVAGTYSFCLMLCLAFAFSVFLSSKRFLTMFIEHVWGMLFAIPICFYNIWNLVIILIYMFLHLLIVHPILNSSYIWYHTDLSNG